MLNRFGDFERMIGTEFVTEESIKQIHNEQQFVTQKLNPAKGEYQMRCDVKAHPVQCGKPIITCKLSNNCVHVIFVHI